MNDTHLPFILFLILNFFIISMYLILFLSFTVLCYSAIHVCFACFILSPSLLSTSPLPFFDPLFSHFLHFTLPSFFLSLYFLSLFLFHFFLILIQNFSQCTNGTYNFYTIFSKNHMTFLKTKAGVFFKQPTIPNT